MVISKKVARVEIRNDKIHIEFGLFDSEDVQIGSVECWNYNAATREFTCADEVKKTVSVALGTKLSGLLEDIRAEIPAQ